MQSKRKVMSSNSSPISRLRGGIPKEMSYVDATASQHSGSCGSARATSSPQRVILIRKGRKAKKVQYSSSPHFSLNQVIAIVNIVATTAIILTAVIASRYNAPSSVKSFIYMNHQATLDQSFTTPQSRSLSNTRSGTYPSLMSPHRVVRSHIKDIPDSDNPEIVWLMSFPNSGTSFTIHMTREATNCTTATNYGLEGEIKDQPSQPAIKTSIGENGPWLELIPGRVTRIAKTILTKTHCKCFCSGAICGPERTFHTPRSFMMGCLTGNQGIVDDEGSLKLVDKTYDRSLVKKAIHLFRHPLDNIVARFHLQYNENRNLGKDEFTQLFPKNATGFHKWCEMDDLNSDLRDSVIVDRRLRTFMDRIPCHRDFFRYTTWHNLAFDTTRAMNLTTMILHYNEYAENFVQARNKVLGFLDLPRVGDGIKFQNGKIYHHYYTRDQRQAIRDFMQEYASAETWAQLKGYDFETADESGNDKQSLSTKPMLSQ